MSTKSEYDRGFQDAIVYCEANYKPFQPMALPPQFVHRGDAWSKGFGEGLITGRNKIINEAYPGNTGFSIANDGKVTIFYPEGHPALKSKTH